MSQLTTELIRLAHAATPETRAELAQALRTALHVLAGADALVTARVAAAFDGLAGALALAADHAACIADQARVIAPPRELN